MFEELDYQPTSIGEISLRKRTDPRFDDEVIFEVKLGEEFLMSSLVTAGEIALADLALNAHQGKALDVVVGGLGLGFTAAAALAFPKVSSLVVVEALQPVIDWHQRALVPLGAALNSDERCSFHCADFFELALSHDGFTAEGEQLFDVILLDIDHSPKHRLTDHGDKPDDDFYHEHNLSKLAQQLKSDGIFAMWSNDPPEDVFLTRLNNSFASASAEVCEFPNPYSEGTSSNTIYLAHK